MVEPGPNSHDAGLGADAPQLCNNRINVTQIATRAIWNVLRRISIVVFYARQTRSPDCCIDWACKILRCRSRLPGIA
jgi:hypothetical protein